MSNESVMAAKSPFGSERVQPGSKGYLAIERARQRGFAPHPEGMALPVLRFVEALDRASRPALHTSPGAASGIPMSRLSLTSGSDPKPIVEKRAGNGEARRRQEGGVLLPGKSGRHLGAGEPAGVV